MRSIWKGNIGFSMVAIPAKLYSAVEDNRVKLHQIHAECGSRLQLSKWCPACSRKVELTEIKKGYEVAEGQNIILEEADFEALPLRSVRQIDIVQFIDLAMIDCRSYEKPYYLTVDDSKGKDTRAVTSFSLLLKVMEMTGMVAVGKLTYRDREHLVVMRPYNGVILLHTLYFASEIRPCDELKPKAVNLTDKELELAKMLLDRMRGDFDHSQYHDEYNDALGKVIEAKATGQSIAVAPDKAPTGDVLDQLIASLGKVGVK